MKPNGEAQPGDTCGAYQLHGDGWWRLKPPLEYNQACPVCNGIRTVVGTVVEECRVCRDGEFDMADLPYFIV